MFLKDAQILQEGRMRIQSDVFEHPCARDDLLLAALHIQAAHAAQPIIPDEAEDILISHDGDIGLLLQLPDRRFIRGQVIFRQHRQRRSDIGHEQRFLDAGIASADHDDIFAHILRPIADHAPADAVAVKFLFVFHMQHLRGRSDREDDAPGLVRRFLSLYPDAVHRLSRLDADDLAPRKRDVQLLRMLKHPITERRSAHCADADIILDLVGVEDLSSRIFRIQHQRVQLRSGRINGSAHPRRASPDNDHIVLFHLIMIPP